MNTHTSWWRRRWWSERATDRVIELAERDAPAEATMDLWTALGHLPPGQVVVVLRSFDDLTEAQTAAQLGCSIGTVKSQHAKVLRRLRDDAAVVTTTEEATP
jgi:DNA-directed RNA polymerase specialized sigma24 family protein